MSRFLLAVALFGLLALAVANDSVTALTFGEGFYRQLTVAGSPSVAHIQNDTATGIAVLGVGVEASKNGETWASGSGKVDAAGFKFKNPADLSDGQNGRALQFYFGYLGVSGTWDASSSQASISAAAGEIVSTWDSIFVYYNNDNTKGFQWTLGNDFLDIAKGKADGFDTVDPKGIISINDNLTWAGIVTDEIACPAGYTSDCKIYKMTTTSTDGVLSFTIKLASQPVMFNGVLIEPNYGKIDVAINYPWSNVAGLADAANARVGIVAYTAGRAGTASLERTNVDGNAATTFSMGDKTAYFSWDSKAEISNGKTTVYADYKSGKSITDFNCGLTCGNSFWFILALKFRVGIIEAFGYKTEMLVFSFDDVKPAALVWDPAIGINDPAQKYTYASASGAAPSLAFALGALLFAVFRQ